MKLQCKQCYTVAEPRIAFSGPHQTAFCPNCGSYIKHIPIDRTGQNDFKIYFGKYKGELVSQMNTPDRISWLRWAYQNVDSFKDWQKEIIRKQIND